MLFDLYKFIQGPTLTVIKKKKKVVGEGCFNGMPHTGPFKFKSSLCFKFFLVRGFFMFLSFNPQLLILGPSSALSGLKAPLSIGGVRRFNCSVKVVSLGLLWQQWSSFFYVAFSLAQVKAIFFWAGAPSLSFFANALSWFSWGFSFLAWKLRLKESQLNSLTASFCFLKFSGSSPRTHPFEKKNFPVMVVGGDFSGSQGWAHVYSSATPRSLQLFFLNCFAKAVVRV